MWLASVLLSSSLFSLQRLAVYLHLYHPGEKGIAHSVDYERRSKDMSQTVFTCLLYPFFLVPLTTSVPIPKVSGIIITAVLLRFLKYKIRLTLSFPYMSLGIWHF